MHEITLVYGIAFLLELLDGLLGRPSPRPLVDHPPPAGQADPLAQLGVGEGAPDSGGQAMRWNASPAAGAVPRDVVAPGNEAVMAPGDLLLLPEGSRATASGGVRA